MKAAGHTMILGLAVVLSGSTAMADEQAKVAKAEVAKVEAIAAPAHRAPAPAPAVRKKASQTRQMLDSFDLGITLNLDAPADGAAARTPRKAADPVVDLRAGAEAAAKVDLTGAHRDVAVPTDEVVLHMKAKTLDSRTVGRVMSANMAQVEHCYERAAAIGKAPKGEVELHFVIDPKGYVAEVSVYAGHRGTSLARCMMRRIKTWRFPAADAPTIVDYPLVFDVAGSTLAP